DHPFVDRGPGFDEDLAAFLQVPDRVSGGGAGAIGHQHAVAARGNGAVPRLPAGKQVVHDAGAFRVGEELRSEADETAGRDAELEPHTTAPVVAHFRHDAAAVAGHGDDDALKLLGHVNHQVLDRLHFLTVDLPGDDLGARHLQLEAFAPHHL